MEGARTDDDEKAVRSAHDDFDGIFATLENASKGILSYGNFGDEQLRWDQRILTQDCVTNESCQYFDFNELTDAMAGSYCEYRR